MIGHVAAPPRDTTASSAGRCPGRLRPGRRAGTGPESFASRSVLLLLLNNGWMQVSGHDGVRIMTQARSGPCPPAAAFISRGCPVVGHDRRPPSELVCCRSPGPPSCTLRPKRKLSHPGRGSRSQSPGGGSERREGVCQEPSLVDDSSEMPAPADTDSVMMEEGECRVPGRVAGLATAGWDFSLAARC
jgi:hypothetical protein